MTDSGEKKLFLVHLGFYDKETNFGVYESHTNIFVAASDAREAKQLVKAMPIYRDKKMHTDGIQEISAVHGYRIKLEKDASMNDESLVKNFGHDELNPEMYATNKRSA